MTLSETLERISKMDAPTSERSTIRQIILPVLSALGWDVDNRNGTYEVRDEYQVSSLKGSGKVDIALMGERGQCACLVEAKSPSVNLDDHVMQLFKYDASNASGTICVLTDGLEWRFYLPREEGNPEERQFARLRLREDQIEQIADDLRDFLSRSAVVNGEAERNAVKALKLRREEDIARRLLDLWREMLTEPDRELVTWVGKRISDQHGLSPSADQVAKIIVATDAPSQPTYSSKPATPEVPAREGSKRQIDYTGYTLFGVPKPWQKGVGMWIDVAEQVYSRDEHDFLEKTKKHLRLTPRSTRILISESPLKDRCEKLKYLKCQ